jgi:chemotaxis protein MotA
MRNKGLLQIESHIENPKESDLFNKYPSFANNAQAVLFFCDNIRLMTLGVENKYLLDEAMEKEIENIIHEDLSTAKALQTFVESLPALGIVAAVLGVIVTMGSISEPPEILGHLIGAALVGTFLGILLAYGVFSPLGHFAEHYVEEKKAFLECIRTGIVSYLQGSAPTICIELVRKQVPHHNQPSFNDFDKIING